MILSKKVHCMHRLCTERQDLRERKATLYFFTFSIILFVVVVRVHLACMEKLVLVALQVRG